MDRLRLVHARPGPRADRDRARAAPRAGRAASCAWCYQPIVRAGHRPDRRRRGAGPLGPSDPRRRSRRTSFIPIAEDAGLISRLGRWVLRGVAAQLAAVARGRHGRRRVLDLDQRLAPPAARHRPWSRRLRRAAAARRTGRGGGPGDHRVGDDRRRPRHRAGALRAACARRADRGRRLRHRLLGAGLPAPLPGHRGQGRPGVRRRPRARTRGRGDRARGGRDEPRAAASPWSPKGSRPRPSGRCWPGSGSTSVRAGCGGHRSGPASSGRTGGEPALEPQQPEPDTIGAREPFAA